MVNTLVGDEGTRRVSAGGADWQGKKRKSCRVLGEEDLKGGFCGHNWNYRYRQSWCKEDEHHDFTDSLRFWVGSAGGLGRWERKERVVRRRTGRLREGAKNADRLLLTIESAGKRGSKFR